MSLYHSVANTFFIVFPADIFEFGPSLTHQGPGLLISIIAIDSDTIGDTFRVSLSVSAIHFCGSIGIGIGDTFVGGIAIDYRRYFERASLT